MNIEVLESRIAPAVLTVTNIGSSGAGTLANAISTSHAGDTIVFAHGLNGVIDVGGTALSINHPLTIDGPGANRIIINAEQDSAVFQIDDFTSGGTATINGLAIINGKASGSGGGIFTLDPLVLKNCVLSGNSAAAAGGAIYANTSTVTISGCTITGNSATGTSATFGYEGGINVLVSKSVTITNTEIIGNTAVHNGGGGFIETNTSNTAENITLVNDVISGNSAGKYYGGLDLKNFSTAKGAKTIVSGCTVSGNIANDGTAGGLYAGVGAFVLTNDNIVGNKATGGDGGGLYASGVRSITISGGRIEDNSTTDYGGGAAFVDLGTVSVTGVTFVGNSASQTGGAIVTNNLSSFSVVGSSFVGNNANIGGGLDIKGSMTTLMSGDLIANNTAAVYGGGIHLDENASGATATLRGCRIIGNVALGTDGGAAFDGGTGTSIKITGTVFSDNLAQDAGGAEFDNFASLTISASTFTGNIASLGNGGGLFLSDSTGTIVTTHITGNVASDIGGGIGGASPSITFGAGDVIIGNVAPTDPNSSL
jgi:fibronectin-binding autotransporter adhesin